MRACWPREGARCDRGRWTTGKSRVDVELQAQFYRRLFNWQIGEGLVNLIAPGVRGPEPGPAGHLRASEQTGDWYDVGRDPGPGGKSSRSGAAVSRGKI